nr:dynamin family protein [Rubellimicrobium arenae]
MAGKPEAAFLALGSDALCALNEERDELLDIIATLAAAADGTGQDRLRALGHDLRTHAATITVVGQVGAGKTSVVNALLGVPGLFPTGPTPTTAVITTAHLNRPPPRPHVEATFQFFERDEWDRLLTGRGRLGELAQRINFREEPELIRAEILAQRQAMRERLGRNFDLLLGQMHTYDQADPLVLRRYLGARHDGAEAASGQVDYAGIVRSADLYLTRPGLPFPFALQDTPGVNGASLMREQVTLRCLRGAEICVLVVPAMQALTSVDLGLLRLLGPQERRPLILFVNRTDELDAPAEQVPQIRAALETALQAQGVGPLAGIVFGSALWAEGALSGRPGDLPERAQAGLLDWARAVDLPVLDGADPCTSVWHLSGLPALLAAIGDGLSAGPTRRVLDRVRDELGVVATRSLAALPASDVPSDDIAGLNLGEPEVQARFKAMSQQLLAELRHDSAEARQALKTRLAAAADQFVESTVTEMLRHIEVYGIEGQWTCDPTRLRVQVRAAFMTFARDLRANGDDILGSAAKDTSRLYRDLLGDPGRGVVIAPPAMPPFPAPEAIGQPVRVDLGGGWWKRWIKLRRGAQAFAPAYRIGIAQAASAILAETEGLASAAESALRSTLEAFLEEHGRHLVAFARAGQASGTALRSATGADRQQVLRQQIQAAADSLKALPAHA